MPQSPASVAATVSAAGNPRATSSANVGPDTMPTGAGHIGAITWCARPTPAGSDGAATNPFDSHTSGAPRAGAASSRTTAGSAAAGVATTSSSACAATRRSDVTAIAGGNAIPGR